MALGAWDGATRFANQADLCCLILHSTVPIVEYYSSLSFYSLQVRDCLFYSVTNTLFLQSFIFRAALHSHLHNHDLRLSENECCARFQSTQHRLLHTTQYIVSTSFKSHSNDSMQFSCAHPSSTSSIPLTGVVIYELNAVIPGSKT
jgi:hypothetical protein